MHLAPSCAIFFGTPWGLLVGLMPVGQRPPNPTQPGSNPWPPQTINDLSTWFIGEVGVKECSP